MVATTSSAQVQGVQIGARQAGRPAVQQVVCSLRRTHSQPFGTRPLQRQRPQLRQVRSADAAPAVGSGWMDQPESQPPPNEVEVFPRLKERDPYKRLGVSREASFEEVQEARNFLVEQYRAHEPSREAIELALDSILEEKRRVRLKDGFRPPRTGRRTDVAGDAPNLSLWQRVRQKFEPSVPSTTLVNDGSVFVALGVWAGWTAAASDPTLPLGAALAFAAWKLYDKRNKRNPDGPYWGGNPMWGALGAVVLALVLGSLLSYALVNMVPLPPRLASEAVGLFLITMCLGFTALYLK
ncbi:hypothetical protein CHLNCDRAFT_132902 [Chlorella variabilis]|uniref:Uncharacterized protein n=1 Tax=Chlorella variabilis TaxID=554065 RepID=E1Z1X0_CHLVA|nr:hypothetical protein CHLNCDRAFT_132902 [Chlorella variabilis]EFN59567.1 hypothetical protein CHLNCDRAFT_132902 [Chlorella variabilis]|eukprot:XP_005851669.1 hypothetical protein CHLNCDRAFT_132902 [Chlorella variabilis]